MVQLRFEVSEELAEAIRRRAGARGTTTSRFIAELVTKELYGSWPEGFFEKVAGGWVGEPLERSEHLPYEERDKRF